MLELININQFYGESHTLWDVSINVEKGKCTCLMGRNGVGKTTILDCIMGANKIVSGDILYQENNINHWGADKRAPNRIAYVPQGRQIFPLLTVEENLKIGLGSRADGLKKIPDFIYEMFPVLFDMKARRGGDLSGGQQQQLAIGRALVTDPHLLLLDEPTEGIQPNIVSDIADVINTLKDEMGMTILLVEQKLPFVRKVVDEFYILDRGRNQANGQVDELNEELIKKYLTV